MPAFSFPRFRQNQPRYGQSRPMPEQDDPYGFTMPTAPRAPRTTTTMTAPAPPPFAPGAQTETDFRRQNFYGSVERNLGRADLSAATFAAGRSMGQTTGQADRAAYIARRGGGVPFEPQAFGQVGQQAPTLYMPPVSGRSSAGGAPMLLPPGANVLGPPAPGATGRAPTPKTPDYEALRGLRKVDKMIPNPDYNPNAPAGKDNPTNIIVQVEEQDRTPDQAMQAYAEQGAAGMFPGVAPTTQPTAPSFPMEQQTAPAFPGDTAGRMNVTEQQARAMWQVLRETNPNAQADELLPQFHSMLSRYGVPIEAAQGMVDRWLSADSTLSGGGAAPGVQVTPGTRVPLSMLGTDTGLDPSQRYGAARQNVPGPTISTPARVRETPAGPERGYTPIARGGNPNQPAQAGARGGQQQAQTATLDQEGQAKQLDEQTAAQLLQQAGGDKERARAAARALGYQF